MAFEPRQLVKRLGRFLSGDRTVTLRPESRPSEPSPFSGEVGRSGTRQFGGFITEDQNSEFFGQSAIRTYDLMRKTDATVGAVLDALKLPILSAECGVESADKDDQGQNDIAEFVRSNLFDTLEGGWHGYLREALGFLDFGFWYHEKVHHVVDGEVRLRKLASRLPTAHYKWVMENDLTTPGVTQMLLTIDKRVDPDAVTRPEIPMSKLVLLTHKREGDNYEGTSVLRAAYKHWYIKDTLYRIDGVKHERGAGVLKITLPDTTSTTDRADAIEMGENFKTNDKSYIVLPNSKWNVDLLANGIKEQSAALMESVNHHDRAILLNVLAQFMALGSSETGSFSLSKDQSSFFTLGLRDIAANIETAINEQVVKELVDLNFGPQEKYPRLRFSKIGEIDFAELSEALSKLKAADLIKVDGNLKAWVHDTFGLTKVTPEDFADEDEMAADAAADGDEPDAPDGTEADPKDPNDPKEPNEPTEPGSGSAPGARNGAGKGASPKDGKLAEPRFWRALTAAEGRMALAEIGRFFDEEQDLVAAELKKASGMQKASLKAQAKRIIEGDDIGAIGGISAPTPIALEAEVADRAKAALEKGKATSAAELGVSIPVTANYTKKVLAAKVALFISQRESRMTDAVKSRLIGLLNNDVGKAAALFDVEKVIDAAADREDAALSGKLTVEFFDEGRYLTFDDMREQIHGLQRSEILDDKTCEMCMSVDGRTLSPSDPFTQVGQLHDNCRGMWVAILKTDAELPDAKALPQSILGRFNTVGGVPVANEFRQLKKPVITSGSRAMRKIKDGDLVLSEDQERDEQGRFGASMGSLVTTTGHSVGDFAKSKVTGPARQRVDGIKDAMAKGAALPPIVVRKEGDRFRIVDGHHRAWAAHELGRKTVDAKLES